MTDPRLDILFLIDSTDFVDDCSALRRQNFGVPVAAEFINETTTPVYTRIKSFVSE